MTLPPCDRCGNDSLKRLENADTCMCRLCGWRISGEELQLRAVARVLDARVPKTPKVTWLQKKKTSYRHPALGPSPRKIGG